MASAQVTITQLPAAGPITGDELVPIVQNGQTVQTTTGDIATQPTQTQSFLTAVQETSLANSRILSAGSGLSLTDGGAQGSMQVNLTGTTPSLNSAGNGLLAKTGVGTITPREIEVGTGLTVADGDGIAGNPLVGLDTFLSNVNSMSASTGLVGVNAGVVSPISIEGTSNEISVANGDASTGNPTVGLADNPVLPGAGSVAVPSGTTAERSGAPVDGMIRYNTELNVFEGYQDGSWTEFSSGPAGVSEIDTGTGLTGGPITSTGTISIDSTVVTKTGVQTLTNKTIDSPVITNNFKFEAAGIAAYTQFSAAIASWVTNFDGYQEIYAVNQNSGSEASMDVVLYNDSSDVNSYFIDMGMNSSNYTSATYTIFTPNSGYLFTGGGLSGQASDLFIGTSNAASDLIFFTGDVLSANVRGRIKGDTGNFLLGTATDTGEMLQVEGSTKFSGASEFGDTVLLSADPTLALQAATKQYVDAATSSGFTVHDAVNLATTAALPANTYSNGSSGVGATLTANATGTLTVDGVLTTLGQRILVKNESNSAYNGAYTVTTAGAVGVAYVLTRATDFDVAGPGEIANNAYFLVSGGSTLANSSYVLSQTATIVVGTTDLPFTLFSSQASYVGGTNINITGQTISLTGTVAATNGGTGTATVTTGDLLYGSASNTWSKLALGSAYKSLTINSSGTQIEWNGIALNQSAAVSGQLQIGNGGTGLSTFTAGDLPYYASGTTLSTLAIGTTNYILTSSGTAPQYTNPSSITVGSATSAGSATTATNLAGGIASQIPYQTGAGATSFIANGTAGQVLTSAGTSAPTWSGINGGTF